MGRTNEREETKLSPTPEGKGILCKRRKKQFKKEFSLSLIQKKSLQWRPQSTTASTPAASPP